MITPIIHKRNFESMSEQIVEMIKSGQYPEGSRIPSEAELAEAFSVGRGSVREAIKSLQLQGILTANPGRGTFVSVGALTCISNNELSEVIQRDDAVGPLLETRLILEPEIAALAALRATPGGITELYRRIEHMENSITRDELLTHGYTFHLQLVGMCGNPILINLYDTISGPLYRLRQMDFVTIDIYRQGTFEHRDILKAVERHDDAAARRLMYDHLITDYRGYIPPTAIDR